MALNEYLQNLEEQNVQEVKTIQVVQNPVVEEICKRYEKWLKRIEFTKHRITTENITIDCLRELVCNAKDVSDFSLMLKLYEEDERLKYSGIFIGILVNISQGEEFKIHTKHLKTKIDNLGFLNLKEKITIKGDAGDYTAVMMLGGKLIVEGNVGFIYAGSNDWKASGEVHINGEERPYLEINNLSTLKAYHKGKQIWPK
ncbi:hypothetical protein HY837_06020 [archaeon]|nr:hypothetical protein [archaeon]